MPTIEVSHKDLCNLIGKKLTIEELKDAILYAKGEIDAVDGDLLKVDIKDTNRPDLWSAEGIAREIRGRYTAVGCPKYTVKQSNVVVKVDKKNKNIRPYTVCAVIKNLEITPDVLSQMIQLQEKICGTFGRNRKEIALGVYDLDRIKPPIRFTTVKPDGIKFIPLEFEEELTPAEILERHPKGKEYGHLLAGLKEYPVFIDSARGVLSIPPIINSDYSGKVTERTRNIFIECSGFDFRFLIPALNVLVVALADRKARIESVKIVYSDKVMITPNLFPKKTSIDIDYLNKVSGLNLTGNETCKLLERARYDAKLQGKKIKLAYPAYRQDIMHQRDVIEDVIISYDYNKIEPKLTKFTTLGKADDLEIFSTTLSEIMIGLGSQEILSYMLTSKKNLFDRMNLEEEKIVEIENPISMSWNVFRNWLLPSLLEFLSRNKHVDYPQNIFEIGDVVVIDEKRETRTKDVRKLAMVLTDNQVNYEQISSILDAFMRSLNINYKLRRAYNPSFIEGRCAKISIGNKTIGIIGEISPKVLNNWKLEKPVIAFEIDIQEIYESL